MYLNCYQLIYVYTQSIHNFFYKSNYNIVMKKLTHALIHGVDLEYEFKFNTEFAN